MKRILLSALAVLNIAAFCSSAIAAEPQFVFRSKSTLLQAAPPATDTMTASVSGPVTLNLGAQSTPFSADGGTPEYSWKGTRLPAGVEISAGGTIRSVTAGRWTGLTAVATDNATPPVSASVTFDLNVNAPPASLLVWGYNGNGQLGTGDNVSSKVPLPAGSTVAWEALSAGRFHSCGLISGSLYCWGDRTGGVLGDGAVSGSVLEPELIGGSSDWTSVSASSAHTCGIKGSGQLYCWGLNPYGELGIGNTADQNTPQLVASVSGWTMVSSGQDHTCGIRQGGELWCWGRNDVGQLGLGPDSQSDLFRPAPSRVGTDSDWSWVSTGIATHTCGIRNGGELYCWGDNRFGALGFDTKFAPTDPYGRPQYEPRQVGSNNDWSTVSVGFQFTCGLRGGGQRWCWGQNTMGELGNAETLERGIPVKSDSFDDWQWLDVGEQHGCGFRSSGLYCWGRNSNGAVGMDGTPFRVTTPLQVTSNLPWTLFSAGGNFTISAVAP